VTVPEEVPAAPRVIYVPRPESTGDDPAQIFVIDPGAGLDRIREALAPVVIYDDVHGTPVPYAVLADLLAEATKGLAVMGDATDELEAKLAVAEAKLAAVRATLDTEPAAPPSSEDPVRAAATAEAMAAGFTVHDHDRAEVAP
jgi:hypothetical protein